MQALKPEINQHSCFFLVVLVQGIPANRSDPNKLFQSFNGEVVNELFSAICHDGHSDLIKSLYTTVICHTLRQEETQEIMK